MAMRTTETYRRFEIREGRKSSGRQSRPSVYSGITVREFSQAAPNESQLLHHVFTYFDFNDIMVHSVILLSSLCNNHSTHVYLLCNVRQSTVRLHNNQGSLAGMGEGERPSSGPD